MSSNTECRITSGASADDQSKEDTPELLTSRELEILNLIFSGKVAIQVAAVLGVSKRTIDFYLGKIYAKLGVSNRAQAYRKAIELGLISPDLDQSHYPRFHSRRADMS